MSDFAFTPVAGTCYMPNIKLDNRCNECYYKDYARCYEKPKKKTNNKSTFEISIENAEVEQEKPKKKRKKRK